jgi:hypothetical protein
MPLKDSHPIKLTLCRIHLASRGFKDNTEDIEYKQGNIRISLRADGISTNLFVELI